MIKAGSELYPGKTIFEGIFYSSAVGTGDRSYRPAYIQDSSLLHVPTGFKLMSVMLKEMSNSLVRYLEGGPR
jgi:hypothetical protein